MFHGFMQKRNFRRKRKKLTSYLTSAMHEKKTEAMACPARKSQEISALQFHPAQQIMVLATPLPLALPLWSKLLCLPLLPTCDGQSLAKMPSYLELGRVYLLYVTLVQMQPVCCTSSPCFHTKALIPFPFFSLCFLNRHFHSCDFNRETKIQKWGANSTSRVACARCIIIELWDSLLHINCQRSDHVRYVLQELPKFHPGTCTFTLSSFPFKMSCQNHVLISAD